MINAACSSGSSRGASHLDVRNVAEERKIDAPVMLMGPSSPHQPRPVKAKRHGQLLNAHIVYDLVIGTLGEGGVDRHKGTVALRGEACREGDGVLFADAHVREAGGKT